MLIPLIVSLISSVSHVLCCILEQLRGVLPAPLTVGRQAGSSANKSISKNIVVSVAFILSLHFSISLLGWGKRKQTKKTI